MTKDDYFRAERINLEHVHFTPELLRCVPAQVAHGYRVLPVFEESSTSLGVAVVDPSDLDTIDGVHSALQRDLVLRVAERQQLDEFIQRLYGERQS